MKLEFIFKWFDFWIGLFWDANKKWLYFFPIPMFGIVFKFAKEKQKESEIYLPEFIQYEGVTFKCCVDLDEKTFSYDIVKVDVTSKHYYNWVMCSAWQNPFSDSLEGFLYLRNVETLTDFFSIAEECSKFLKKNIL